MAHFYHGDAKKSKYSKMHKIVGHADHYKYPADKAAERAYYENIHADPLTLPAQERIGPLSAGNPPGSAVKRK